MREQLKLVEGEVQRVLDHFLKHQGCPCNYERFIYWAGKEQGPGWQDNIQNQLVRSALKLDCLEISEEDFNDWGYQDSYICGNCGSLWRHYSVEWRMLAFHERLLRKGETAPVNLYKGIITSDIAATVGHEPVNRPALDLYEWADFMLGGNHF